VGRAFTLSLAGHAALIFSFLLLSATRQPLRIIEPVRPIRLVTYIEPPAAPVSRPSRAAEATAPPQPRVPAVPVERAERLAAPRVTPAPAPPRADRTPPPAAVAVPKIVLPGRDPAPAARPAAPRPAAEAGLGDRISRGLAAASRNETPPAEAPAPKLTALALPPEAPAARPAGPAFPVSTAQPPGTVVPIGDFPFAWYLALLRERVFSLWSPPSEPFLGGRAPVTLVAFRIDRVGRVDRLTLKEGSGHTRFDRSALAAVKALGQAPPLPDQYPEAALDVVIRFQNER